jgi:signal transduction histidine kinase
MAPRPAAPGSQASVLDQQRYAPLDMSEEESFDGLLRLATQITGVPMAFISVHDGQRQRFKARLGLEKGGNLDKPWPVMVEFAGRRLILCTDTQLDGRFAGLPAVVGAPGIRFYAAVALVTPQDATVGALAIMDVVARNLSNEQSEALALLAEQIVAQLELQLARRTLEALHGQSRELAERVEADRTLEIQSLAADLHDGLGQELAALSMQMSSFLHSPSAQTPAVREPLESMSEYLRNCMKSCRRIAEGHGGFMIRDLTLLEALKRSTQALATPDLNLEFSGSGQSLSTLDETTAYHLFRIGYEAIRNACTHSDCARVQITYKSDDHYIDLIIEDDGTALVNMEQSNAGIGRSVMSYRARSIGADLRFVPLSKGGLRVECHLARRRV